MPFPKCVLHVRQEFMFIKMGHNISAYNMFKKLTRNACQRNRAVIAGKWPVALLKQGANISKRPFFRNFTCINAGRDGRIPALILQPVPLGLWDEAHQALRL